MYVCIYVCMYVCMYVCTVVIPYYVLIQKFKAVAIDPVTGRSSQGYRSGSHEFVLSALSLGGGGGRRSHSLTLNSKTKP